MDSSLVRPASEASQQALRFSAKASPRERAYVEALAKRYSDDPSAVLRSTVPGPGRSVRCSRRYATDDDAGTLYAEALMDLRPWHYWTSGGKPLAPSTLEQLRVAKKVVKRNPNHPGACHYYIHAIEASRDAYKALPCARRLGSMMPGAGHLVHMPTHIYIKLGQWDLAAEHNAHAVHADEQFISEQHPPGAYPIGYYPHNFHMMWYAWTCWGGARTRFRRRRSIEKTVPTEVVRQVPNFDSSPRRCCTPSPASPSGMRSCGNRHRPRSCVTPRQSGTTLAVCRTPPRAGPTIRGEHDSLVAIEAATPAEQMLDLNSASPVLPLRSPASTREMSTAQPPR